MKTLRARMILSHLLPIVIVVPLIGIALIYFLETRVLLPGLLKAYSGNAALVAEITRDQLRIWSDPVYAQTILAQVSPRLSARVMLFSASGRLLASTDPADLKNLTDYLIHPALQEAQQGKIVQKVYYNRQLRGEALDLWEPVYDTQFGVVIGVVRITYLFEDIGAQFVQQRLLIAGVLLLGLAVGALIGWRLAVGLERPLSRATEAVRRLAEGEPSEIVPMGGPQEIRVLVEAVNVLAERLKNLESARRQLLANLVHELGRPLGALRSAVQALLNGAVNDPALSGELLNGMENELVRLQSLLGELTHLYDQVLGDLELERKPVDLKAWLGELIAPWQVNAAEQGIRWETVIPDNLPSLSIDSVRMGQALGNLLSNAVKFTPAGGLIRLEVSQTPTEVRICVRDTGAGIPPDELEKIFTPFYRGTQGKRFVEGMGLGLSIARDVVKAHGGRIDVESIVGQGSAFTIVLPLQG